MTESLHDKDIREPLFDFLEDKYGKVRIIEEKQMGRSRADVVMVTESALCGIEIKSDADTYARLSRQVKDYDKYYDYNLVVSGTSHALHIKEHVPEYWGIITVEVVEGKMDFYVLREPQENPYVTWKRKLESSVSFWQVGEEISCMWIIEHIFDGDYGCKEAESGSKRRVFVTLENG